MAPPRKRHFLLQIELTLPSHCHFFLPGSTSSLTQLPLALKKSQYFRLEWTSIPENSSQLLFCRLHIPLSLMLQIVLFLAPLTFFRSNTKFLYCLFVFSANSVRKPLKCVFSSGSLLTGPWSQGTPHFISKKP